MTLGEKQEKFTLMIARLIIRAYQMGYQIRLGHALRCQDCKTGKAKSLHKDKLAMDINLFKNGVFLQKTSDHQPLGEEWESMGGAWGGRFGDGNHYSLEHEGRK
jgi:hypothetical protein